MRSIGLLVSLALLGATSAWKHEENQCQCGVFPIGTPRYTEEEPVLSKGQLLKISCDMTGELMCDSICKSIALMSQPYSAKVLCTMIGEDAFPLVPMVYSKVCLKKAWKHTGITGKPVCCENRQPIQCQPDQLTPTAFNIEQITELSEKESSIAGETQDRQIPSVKPEHNIRSDNEINVDYQTKKPHEYIVEDSGNKTKGSDDRTHNTSDDISHVIIDERTHGTTHGNSDDKTHDTIDDPAHNTSDDTSHVISDDTTHENSDDTSSSTFGTKEDTTPWTNTDTKLITKKDEVNTQPEPHSTTEHAKKCPKKISKNKKVPATAADKYM